jgi:chromosome segregation ATPase
VLQALLPEQKSPWQPLREQELAGQLRGAEAKAVALIAELAVQKAVRSDLSTLLERSEEECGSLRAALSDAGAQLEQLQGELRTLLHQSGEQQEVVEELRGELSAAREGAREQEGRQREAAAAALESTRLQLEEAQVRADSRQGRRGVHGWRKEGAGGRAGEKGCLWVCDRLKWVLEN